MDKLFCYHLVVMFMASVAIMLIWVGFATPGWLVVTFQEDLAAREYTVSSLNRSLYYDIQCPQELYTCEPCNGGEAPNDCIEDNYNSTNYNYHYSWVESVIKDKEEWTAWRVIMTIVVVAAFVGWILVLVLVCCLLRPFVYRVIATSGFVAWIIAALLIWIPVGMVADMHLDIEDTIDDDIPHDATLHIPYSIVVAAVGGFLALITAIMLLYLIGICGGNDRSSRSTASSQEIFSQPSKRTPTLVQGGYYYGPYPYYNQEPQMLYRDVPVAYQYPSTQYVTSYQYPRSGGATIEEEVHSEYPHYKGEGHERWYDNRALRASTNPFVIPRT